MRGRCAGEKALFTPVFMHCNERDHTVAFGLGNPERRINHLMLEVDNLDDVGLTAMLAHERIDVEDVAVATIRFASGKGSGRSSTASTREKIAVFAPIPSASIATATAVKPGLLASIRKA